MPLVIFGFKVQIRPHAVSLSLISSRLLCHCSSCSVLFSFSLFSWSPIMVLMICLYLKLYLIQFLHKKSTRLISLNFALTRRPLGSQADHKTPLISCLLSIGCLDPPLSQPSTPFTSNTYISQAPLVCVVSTKFERSQLIAKSFKY